MYSSKLLTDFESNYQLLLLNIDFYFWFSVSVSKQMGIKGGESSVCVCVCVLELSKLLSDQIVPSRNTNAVIFTLTHCSYGNHSL